MSGSVFAVLTALAFAFTSIFARRAVIKVPDASVGVLITVPLGVLFCMVALILTGQIRSVASLSWQSNAWLSAAGILHYVVGRSLNYNCVQLVGANIANILRNVSALVAAILGVSLLGEPLSWELVIGVLLIVIGITLAGLNPQMFRDGQALFSNMSLKAFLFGFGTGVSWGITPILIKVGLGGSVSPFAGAFVSFLAATVVLSVSLLNPKRRAALVGIPGKAIGLFCTDGLLSSTANLLRYVALSIAPASVVHPLISVSPVFLLGLSFLFNRKLEVFSIPIIVGTGAVVIGTIVLV